MPKVSFIKKITLATFIIFGSLLLAPNTSYAWTPCDELGPSQQNNPSIQNACNNLANDNSITEHAAAWLTNKVGSGDYYNTTITANQPNGTVEISIISAVVTKYAGGSYPKGANRYAREVKVLTSNPSRRSPGEGNDLPTAPYLKDVPDTLNGGYFPSNGYMTAGFSHKNLQLDIDEFKRNVPANSCGNGNPNCYQTTVYVYRCYSIVEYGTVDTWGGSRSIYGGAPNNSCSAVPSTIRVIIPGIPKPDEDTPNSDTSFSNEAQITCRSSADAGPYYGNTTSSSKVANNTSSLSASVPGSGMNSASGEGYIFAKPGDKIQFSHAFCFGTQGLKNGSDKANYLTISSNRSLGDNASNSIVTGNKVTLDKSTRTPSQLTNRVDDLKDYGFSINSPRSTSYTVPNSIVGTNITQTFTHNNLDGYVNKRSKKTGTCGCNANTASAEYLDLTSYSSAKSSSNSYPIWGQLNNYNCTQGGNCSCACTSGTPPDNCAAWSCGAQYKYNTGQSVSFPKSYDNEATEITKTTSVYIPYNFTTTVNSDRQNISSSGVVYAGETAISGLRFEVKAKANTPVTGNNTAYLTSTPSTSKYRVIAFTTTSTGGLTGNSNASISGDNICGYFGKTLNSDCKVLDQGNGALSTKEIKPSGIVPDVAVGTKYCVAIGVYPADSHNWAAPNNDNNRGIAMSGGNTWNISGASCRTIAKEPNFQIWNGGISSSGNISTSTSEKALNSNFSNNYATKTLFGSWAEQAVIANGSVTNFASGAALGYGGYNLTTPGGHSPTSNFKDLSPLSISNASNNVGSSNIVNDSSALLARLYARFAPDDIPETVTISNNITSPDGPYYSIEDLSQTIIFAKKGIEISSDVTRIDAWLIVEDGYINTCKEFNSKTTSSTGPCNQQLTITGPIFAKQLYLNRTAGAGNGNDSITPAEILNLRPDVYLWAYSQARNFSEAYVTYSRELAPRF